MKELKIYINTETTHSVYVIPLIDDPESSYFSHMTPKSRMMIAEQVINTMDAVLNNIYLLSADCAIFLEGRIYNDGNPDNIPFTLVLNKQSHLWEAIVCEFFAHILSTDLAKELGDRSAYGGTNDQYRMVDEPTKFLIGEFHFHYITEALSGEYKNENELVFMPKYDEYMELLEIYHHLKSLWIKQNAECQSPVRYVHGTYLTEHNVIAIDRDICNVDDLKSFFIDLIATIW